MVWHDTVSSQNKALEVQVRRTCDLLIAACPACLYLLEILTLFSEETLIFNLYEFLKNNYVEDDDHMFRFDYSRDFLQWHLTAPNYYKNWLVSVIKEEIVNKEELQIKEGKRRDSILTDEEIYNDYMYCIIGKTDSSNINRRVCFSVSGVPTTFGKTSSQEINFKYTVDKNNHFIF